MTIYLKTLRKKHHLSQEYLANIINVSRPTYAQMEKGKRKLLVEEAQQLADFYGLSLTDFLSGKDVSPPKIHITPSHQPKTKPPNSDERISIPQENIDKFKEVLLYILDKIGGRVSVGEAVICKLLYFIDFDYYEKYEEQLTGAVYIKNHHGPTPAAFVDIMAQMQKDGDLDQVMKQYYQYHQKKYLARRKADLSSFSARELALIDWEINRFQDFNASKMEEYSHQDVPWITADEMQPIDYESVFYRTPEYSVRKYAD